MAIFCVLLFIPIVVQHFVVKGFSLSYKERNKIALFSFFFILTLMIMLRHKSVGNDTVNYIYFFKDYSMVSWDSIGKLGIEFGYGLFNKLISVFTQNPQVFLAIIAVVVSMTIYPTYKRLCVDSSLTIVLFCTMSTFVMMFSGIRQMLAIGIGFVAYKFTHEKKVIPFLIAVMVAMSFHISAFMLLFMYPMYHAKITKKWLFIVVPFLGIIFVFNKPIFGILSIILERYTEYNTSIEPTGAYTMLILFVMFAIFAFIIPDEKKLDSEVIGLRNFLLLSVALQMFAPLHSLAMRMNYYYIIFIPLLIPKIIEARNDKWKQLAIMGRHVMVVFFLVYFFISIRGDGNLNVFPYHFFWETVL